MPKKDESKNRFVKTIKDLDYQTFYDGNKVWKVSRLIVLASELEVMEIPFKHFNFYNLIPNMKTMKDFVEHVDKVHKADLTCPIILDEEGYVMDGRHRIAKALLMKKESIKAVRFEKTPKPDYLKD